METVTNDAVDYSNELTTDAPSPILLQKRELGHRNYIFDKWKVAVEENRLSSLRIVGTLPVIFTSRAAATCLDIDKPESDFLLAGSSKGSIDVVNLRYAQLRKNDDKPAIQLKYSHKHMINAIQWYSENISMFVTASQDGTVKLWDLDKQRPFVEYPIDNPKQMHWNEIDRTNPLIAVSNMSSNVILIDCRSSNREQNVRNRKTEVTALRWYPHEKLLCTGDNEGGVVYWDIRNVLKPLQTIPKWHTRRIAAIRFTSDGKYLVFVDALLNIYIVDAITLELIIICKAMRENNKVHPNSRNLCLVEEGRYLRIGVPTSNEKLSWIAVDLKTKQVVLNDLLSGHMNPISACAYRNGSQQLITASIGIVINWSSEGERARSSLEMESVYRQTRRDDWSDED